MTDPSEAREGHQIDFMLRQLDVHGSKAFPCEVCRREGSIRVHDVHALLAALVQAEQEKARAKELADMAITNQVRAYMLKDSAEARLASQEATIRQVAQEMKHHTELYERIPAVVRWADTLQAITGELKP